MHLACTLLPRHFLTASAGMVVARRVVFRSPGVFRDVFLTRHAHVAIEIPIRVFRTSPDL